MPSPMTPRTITLALLPLLALACGPGREPPSNNQPPPLVKLEKTSALEAANRNLRSVLVGAAHAGQFAEGQALLGDLFRLGDDVAVSCPEGTDCPQPTEQTLEDEAAAMADDLAARILNVANVEVEEETRIVLALDPQLACADDAGCSQALAQIPVRIELTSRRENDIDLALTVGASPVATAQLYRDHLAVDLDLGAAMDASTALAAAGEGSLPQVSGTIRGRIRLELSVNGANDYTLALSITSPINVDATVNGETLAIAVGVAQPLASLRIDGATPKVVFESNSGPFDLTLPLAIFASQEVSNDCPPDSPDCVPTEPSPALTGTLGLHVAPSTAKVTIDAANRIAIDRLVVGGMNATYDGTQIVSLSVNGGQQLSADVTSDDSGVSVSVAPQLDVRATIDLSPLADQLTDVPAASLRDSLQLLLNGASTPAVRFSDSQVEVLQGRLSLSSSAAGRTVVVEAGRCLESVEPDPDQTSEHVLDLLAEATCR